MAVRFTLPGVVEPVRVPYIGQKIFSEIIILVQNTCNHINLCKND